MNDLIQLAQNPLVWKIALALFIYWVFSAAVGALDTPSTSSSALYRYVFRFSHILSGNLNRAAVALKVPGAEGSK